MIDLLLRGGTVVSELGQRLASVGIADGRIVFLGPASDAPEASRTIDCEDRYVLPGVIDPHWHIGQQPGPPPPTERWLEDVGPETAAAARGGITTVFSMYARRDPWPPIIEQLIAWGNERSHIDFNFHPILQNAEHIDQIDALYAMGVTTYKFFFDAYKGWEGEQIALSPLDAGLVHRLLTKVASLGDSVALVHAEDQDLIYELQELMRASGRTDLSVWADSRPALAEAIKSYEAIEIAKEVGAALYLVHIGAALVAEMVRQARAEGHRIYGETCPHYLTHSADMEAEVGVYAKVNNAIKSREDAEGLWRAIRNGGITNMGTDHVCWTVEEKEMGGGKHDNIWNAMPGISGGTEHWLPVMLTGVAEGRVSLSDVARVTSTANARLFGLFPQKGTLEPGSDADVVVVDLDKSATVKASEFYRSPAATGWSLYEGMTFHGMPVLTIARGLVLVEDGEVVGEASGRYVPRRPGARAVVG